ncbi:MAG: ABC transporter ATP-binding protein [Opitutales bacterium]|nr:ABC transporter ATP-binding protein [Opitutales bacterium]
MTGPLKNYTPFLKPYTSRILLGILLGSIAGAASGLGVPYFIQRVFKTIFDSQDTSYSLMYLIGIAACLPAVFLVRGVAGYCNQFIISVVGLRMLQDVRAKVFDKMQRLPLKWYEQRHTGDLLARIVGDTTQMNQALMTLGNDGVQYVFQSIGGICYLVFLSVQNSDSMFILMLIAMTPLMTWPVRLIGKHLKRRGREVQNSLGSMSEALTENLHGSVEIRAFNLQERERGLFLKRLNEFLHASVKLTKYDKLPQPLMEIIAVSLLSVSFVYAYRAGIGFDVFSGMGAALYFSVDSFKRMVRAWNIVQRSQGAFERVEQIMSAPDDLEGNEDGFKLERARGEVSMQGVHFAYGEEPTLDDINVEIAPGTVCGLVGPSGAGKSTFVKLLPRFYDVNAGVVRVDGHDVRELNLESLRRQIAYVPQSPVLFNDTVMNNILLGRPGATREEAIEAAIAANADEFIRTRLEKGYDTMVGENAGRLSGGQRQRLALARAFLRDAPILILDEATSALDSESEAHIYNALEKLVKGRTVFIVAHRFSTLKLCDRVLVFDRGRIAASGKPEELMKSSDLYRQLHELQALT